MPLLELAPDDQVPLLEIQDALYELVVLLAFDLSLDSARLFARLLRVREAEELSGAEGLDHLSHLHQQSQDQVSELILEAVGSLSDVLLLELMKLVVDECLQGLRLPVESLDDLVGHVLALNEILDVQVTLDGTVAPFGLLAFTIDDVRIDQVCILK